MTGRLFLAVLALVGCEAAFAQVQFDELPAPPQPANTKLVVTLGSSALTMNDEPCKAVAFTPDGRQVCVLTQQSWHRWDLATGRHVSSVVGKLNYNDTLYPVRDGSAVVCLGRDQERAGKVRVLELKNGGETHAKAFSAGETLVPSDDGACVAVAGSRNARVTWLDGKTPDVVAEGVADLRRLAKAAGANVLAFVGDDCAAVHTAAGLWKLDLPKDTAYTAVALTADGAVLATASAVETDNGKRPGPIDLWDVATRKKLRTMEPVEWFSEAPYRVRFTPDGKVLVAGDGAYLRGWNTTTGAKTFAVEPGWGWVGNVQISPDGRHVAVAYPSRPMVFELASGRQPTALIGHSGPVWEIALSPDGRRAATAMFGRPSVYVWDTATGQNVGEFQAPFARAAAGGRVVPGRVRVQFSPDGRTLLTTNESSGAGTPIRLWDAATFGLLREMPTPAGDDATATFTRGGVFAVLGRKPTLIDPATGKTLWEKPTVPAAARVIVSPRGDRVAVEGRKGTAVWDATTGRELDTVPGEPVQFTFLGGLVFTGKKHSLQFRDRGQEDRLIREDASDQSPGFSETGLIALPHYPDTYLPEVHVYAAHDGRRLSTCENTHVAVYTRENPLIVFSRDGRTMAVVGKANAAVRCFETYSGQELFRTEATGAARAAVFAPDGRTFFLARGDEERASQVQGWDTTGGAWGEFAVVRADEVAKLTAAFGDKPAFARKALYRLATRPAEAIAFAKEVTKHATEADYADYGRRLAELDAPPFATREAATKALVKAGWRAEALMRRALAGTESPEVRERLEKLLAKRDMRPLRAVHLLEVIGSPATVAALKEIAGGPAESLVVQDAKWSLERLEGGEKR